MESFEKEGIANLTALHDQLVSASHAEAEVVRSKFEEVSGRWRALQELAARRRAKLDEVQGHFHHAENLCLMFAREDFQCWGDTKVVTSPPGGEVNLQYIKSLKTKKSVCLHLQKA